MNLLGRRGVLLSLSVAIALIPGCCSTPRASTVSPVSAFAVVDGVKPHYLDWGGKGEPLIFIAGTGSTANTFDELAPRFTDHFHVLALTRRGFGKSDKPPSGYDVPTLTEDVCGFLDEKHIDRANFVCHSAGGDEVTLFASTYPQRTGKLVYLEAAYDRSGVSAMEASDPMGTDVPQSPEQALHWKGMDAYKPDFTRLKGPVLAFYATFSKHWAVNDKTPPELARKAETYMETVVRPHQQRSIQMFERDVPTARVIVLDDTDHYFFEDPKLSEYVVDTMRAFLLGQD